jgi:hypothetical protein
MGDGIFDAYFQSGATFHENVTTTLTYAGGNLTQVDETISGVLRRRTTLTYTGSDLTGVNVKVYDTDGLTILKEYTDTLTYTDGDLTSVVRVVA